MTYAWLIEYDMTFSNKNALSWSYQFIQNQLFDDAIVIINRSRIEQNKINENEKNSLRAIFNQIVFDINLATSQRYELLIERKRYLEQIIEELNDNPDNTLINTNSNMEEIEEKTMDYENSYEDDCENSHEDDCDMYKHNSCYCLYHN